MKIKDIIGINNAKLVFGNAEEVLNNFSKDTRTIKDGDTYIGIKGEIYDGSVFFEDAFSNGAKTCIVSNIEIFDDIKNKYADRNLIMVDNVVEFLTLIAKKKRENLNIPIIAVTGSVGKTSTKNIIADVLSTKYRVLKTEGNLNTNIGLSLTLLSLTDEEIVVLEMGMSEKGEISVLTNIAKPDVAVITNIGTSHIGNLGSRENILKAKLEILEGLKGPIIINNDTDLLNDWYKNNNINNEIITYGIDNISHYQATNISYDKKGSHYNLDNELVDVNVIGKHFIYNSLVAFAIGDLFNIDHKNIKNKLKNLTLEPNRMELINNNYTIINDTYNASYDSIYYALEVLSKFEGRKIAVLGDILELGEFSEEIHRNIGNLIIKNNIDVLITIGESAKYINEEATNNGFNTVNSYHFGSNKEAINFINSIKSGKDNILVKASHGMNFIEIVNGIKE
ncbi:MAG: UDP-N-acetylmuramoyl-tripeptide--D-alanyl-D-alanine ligase [Firmicutes bacterium]|nr:UDP-N-acetylmuramoyl-tripeptide--D-alanyl-D-alanine ligase [Bacillota bacterium]